MVLDKHFVKYYWKYALTFIIGVIALVLVDVLQLKIPDVIGDVVDGIRYSSLTKELLGKYCLTMLVVAMGLFVGRFLWRICIFGNGIKIEADIRNEMFRHMEKLSTRYFHENKTGALMALYTNDLQTIREGFGRGTLLLFDATALGILAFLKMLKLSGSLTLICFIPLVFVTTFSFFMRRRISKKVRLNLEAFSEMSDYVQEDFSGISVVKAYVKEMKRTSIFNKYNKKNMDTCINFVKDQSLVSVIIGTVLKTITLLIILLGGYSIYAGIKGDAAFTIGELTKFNAYFGSIIWPCMALSDLINLRSRSKASEERVGALLDEKVEINDNLLKYETPIEGKIEFRDLSFNYPDSELPILSHINFTINKGEICGIMGATGSGKTTIVELLLRLYNIDKDKILLDDLDIMGYSIEQVRDSIAYVPQETFLFKQTIDENISFALPHVEPEKVKNAAYAAGISSDIEEFKEGYHTMIGERGVTVSGGQKQRISIARALIKDAPILILDDSLSAVDTLTERHILAHLKEMRQGKTTIIIAHRISTLENLDKIIVVDDGKINDIGTHNELLSRCEIYQREVKLQELEKEESEA